MSDVQGDRIGMFGRCETSESTADCNPAREEGKEGKELQELQEVHEVTYNSALLAAQEESLRQGRQSCSRAVRRAELHAMTSGRDPRHETLARDTKDDVSKKVADLRMTPIDGRELYRFQEANTQGRLRVHKLEAELDSLISSSLRYKSPYKRSAQQLAKKALEAAEQERLSSAENTKTTRIIETKRNK